MNFSEILRTGLELPNFDVNAARDGMSLKHRARERPSNMEGEPRVGAVLALFYPLKGEAHVVLTKRPESLRDHSGQVSFPGGRREEGESFKETALREAWEEVGIMREDVRVLGRLPSFYIPPTDFVVHPFIGWLDSRPEFVINRDEVAVLLETPVSHLLNPETRDIFETTFGGWVSTPARVPYYDVEGHKVWGATAMLLSEILARTKEANYQLIVMNNG